MIDKTSFVNFHKPFSYYILSGFWCSNNLCSSIFCTCYILFRDLLANTTFGDIHRIVSTAICLFFFSVECHPSFKTTVFGTVYLQCVTIYNWQLSPSPDSVSTSIYTCRLWWVFYCSEKFVFPPQIHTNVYIQIIFLSVFFFSKQYFYDLNITRI